ATISKGQIVDTRDVKLRLWYRAASQLDLPGICVDARDAPARHNAARDTGCDRARAAAAIEYIGARPEIWPEEGAVGRECAPLHEACDVLGVAGRVAFHRQIISVGRYAVQYCVGVS